MVSETTLIELLKQEYFLKNSMNEQEIHTKKSEIDTSLGVGKGEQKSEAVKYLSDMLEKYISGSQDLGSELQLISYALAELDAKETIPLLKSVAEKYINETYSRNRCDENFYSIIGVLNKFGAEDETESLMETVISLDNQRLDKRREKLFRPGADRDEIKAKAASGKELTTAEQIELLDPKNPLDQGEILYMVALLQYQRFPVSAKLTKLQQGVANELGPKYHDALRVAQERAQQTRKLPIY